MKKLRQRNKSLSKVPGRWSQEAGLAPRLSASRICGLRPHARAAWGCKGRMSKVADHSKTFGAQVGSFLPDKRLRWNTWLSTMTRRVCRALKETELLT